MLATTLFALCGALMAPPPTVVPAGATAPAAAAHERDGDPMKALDAWMKLYRRGRIDYRSKEDISKKSLAAKYDVRGESDLGNATWAGDLRMILDALAEQNDAEAAHAVAEVAAVGLDDGEYTYAMAPYEVRRVAIEALAKMTSQPAKDELLAGARGEWRSRKYADAERAAALLALGHIGDPAALPTLKAALSDGNSVTRIHAVLALQQLGGEPAAEVLVGVIELENDDAVLVTAAKALREIYAAHRQKGEDARNRDAVRGDDEAAPKRAAPPPSARLAVRAAIKALGRTNWRADMVLLRLLDDFRSAEAIPALITVLERFEQHPEEVERGRLSGLLKVRVHELLVAMTGAVFPADEPARWREMWERDKDRLADIVEKPRADAPKAGGTSAAGFVGIPVEGTRVVFVLDLSGSMEWPMKEGDAKVRRLDYAKRELLKAVSALSPNAMFNLVTFNGDDEAETWSKKLVEANDRNKRRFEKFVEKLRPLGGTNLWSGMEQALNIKTLVYGNHYETTVDEIFLLSDGAPSVGEVVDPIEILRLVSEVNRFKEVRINTVFISSETPPQVAAAQRQMSLTPKELMRRMAKQNGGRFRDV